MRILEVTNRYPEPSQPFVTDKVRWLLERGHHVVVVADPSDEPVDERLVARHAGRLEVRWRPRSPGEFARCLLAARARDPRGVRRAIALARSREGGYQQLRRVLPLVGSGTEVADFEWVNEAARLVPYMGLLDFPKVVTCHGSDIRVSTLESDRTSSSVTELLVVADRVRCVSDELAERCVELGAARDRLRVLPVGVDTEWFTGTVDRASRIGPLRLVSVGRLHWVKGYEYALRAVRLLLDEGVDVAYTIVGGDDGGRAQVSLAVRDLGLEAHVNMPGHLPRLGVRAVLAVSDAFVLSSVSEGASAATLEAMAMGLPVVATTAGGTPELVRDELDGFLVAPRDPESLAAAVLRLKDPEVRAAMGRLAADRARGRFDAATMLDRLVEVYAELVGAHSGGLFAADPDLVSVVIPARDAEGTIDEQLRALSHQLYDGRWEVVVADNGSSDGTRDRVLSWRAHLPGLRVVDARGRRGSAHARNAGVRAAHGSRILLCDADDVVGPGWMQALADALKEDWLVTGPVDPAMLNRPGTGLARPGDEGPRLAEGYRPMAPTGNLGFRREVFDSVGGFDESLRRGSDMDFGWRAQRAGWTVQWVPRASVHVRSRSRFYEVLRQAFSDGAAGPALYLRHRASGLEPATAQAVTTRYRRLLSRAPKAFRRPTSRYRWIYDVGHSAGRLAGSLLHRTRYL